MKAGKPVIKVYKFPLKDQWDKLAHRPLNEDAELKKKVSKILKTVRTGTDKALRKFSLKFDGFETREFEIPKEEISESSGLIDAGLKKAIDQAKLNIEKFHSRQQEKIHVVETMPGIKCWRRSEPIERIGFYIPGGSAPLFSTLLMLAVPAKIAGCREMVVCTPPSSKGRVHPAILYAAMICGVTKIYRVGGAQAIGAMAYGTETIPKVDKIFGPGNSFVTMAKQLVQYETAIDLPAGPSELVVIADTSANIEFVAADLLSQAEHGPDSQVIFLTNDETSLDKLQVAVEAQLNLLHRRKIILKSLKKSKAILFHTLDEAIDFSNLYAPEHLVLNCSYPDQLAMKVRNAGSVFLGNYSPEAAGDYASGTNHTLPTNGYARAYSGVSVDSFVKKITYQELTQEGLNNIASTVMAMAEAEGLDAHKNAISIRIKNE